MAKPRISKKHMDSILTMLNWFDKRSKFTDTTKEWLDSLYEDVKNFMAADAENKFLENLLFAAYEELTAMGQRG